MLLLDLLLVSIPFAMGYGIRAWRERGVYRDDPAIRAERDRVVTALQTSRAAIRAALNDPGLAPSTVIMLDDARSIAEKALDPSPHRPGEIA